MNNVNIFYLNSSPETCAKEHCDKHAIKMILEYCQILSTAHRVLDGRSYTDKTTNGRSIQRYSLTDERLENNLYKATHINHPSNIWVRKSSQHYEWLYELLYHTCREYTRRYNKVHKSESLLLYLFNVPENLKNNGWIDPPPAMPDEYKVDGDVIQSYKNYYIGAKNSFATWKSPSVVPNWFVVAN